MNQMANAETGFERVQKIVFVNENFIIPKIIVERNGNYASYSTYMTTDTALPEVIQTFPLNMFNATVCGFYDAGYKIVEQIYSDEDLK